MRGTMKKFISHYLRLYSIHLYSFIIPHRDDEPIFTHKRFHIPFFSFHMIELAMYSLGFFELVCMCFYVTRHKKHQVQQNPMEGEDSKIVFFPTCLFAFFNSMSGSQKNFASLIASFYSFLSREGEKR
jgi:hypothetical protein